MRFQLALLYAMYFVSSGGVRAAVLPMLTLSPSKGLRETGKCLTLEGTFCLNEAVAGTATNAVAVAIHAAVFCHSHAKDRRTVFELRTKRTIYGERAKLCFAFSALRDARRART